jgi:SRSO17 transposase
MRWSLRGIGELAQHMLTRAFAAGVPAEWVVGHTVYGDDEVRLWLEEQQKNYVLAVSETHQVWVQGRPQPVGRLAALLPEEAWVVLSAGEASKGPRLSEWAWLELPDEMEAGSERTCWVLIRRSLADRSARASYRVYGPATTTLPEVVRVTGNRWKIEEGYEQAKGQVGLDQYEVRTWRAWYRYVTLALLAYAALVVMQRQARAHEKQAEALTSGSN